MAKVADNLLTEGLSGKIGKRLVFRRLRNGSTVLCTAPDFSERVFSEGQLSHQSRFQRASAYAKAAARTQPFYIERAQQTGQPAYNLALSDWFRAPVIQEVTRLGHRIHVEASDNVLVTRVVISLSDEQGQSIEQGEAVRMDDARWEYITAAPEGGAILVEAFDLAGNVARQES
jgi:hypothetical protein